MQNETTPLFIGVDAGASTIKCVLIDELGTSLSHHQINQPGNITVSGISAAHHIHHCIIETLGKINKDQNQCQAVFVGMAGINSEQERNLAKNILEQVFAETNFSYQHLDIQNDIQALQTAAFGYGDGIVAIGGTGSNFFGKTTDGRTASAGGQGHILADKCSAYDLGLKALQRIINGMEGVEEDATILRQLVTEKLHHQSVNIVEPGDFSGWINTNSDFNEKLEIAALAPLVTTAVEQYHDPIALKIFQESMLAGAKRVQAVASRLGLLDTPNKLRIGITGSVITSDLGRQLFEAQLQSLIPGATTFIPELSPATGAAFLAARLAGLSNFAPTQLNHES